jgi:hypothetical protein
MQKLLGKPWLLILLAPLLPLWRAVFLGETIGPWDQIAGFWPWNKPSDKPWDVLQADGALQFYGWRDLVFESWHRGKIPFWNPYQFGGTPLLANSQSGALYPLHIIVGVLGIPTGIALTLLAYFHLAWAGIGTYKLVRTIGGTAAGATLAGAGFALSPFMAAWTALPSVITTVSWIPWLMAGLIWGLRDGWTRLAWSTVIGSTAMLILAGHLQFAAYGFLAAGICIVLTRAPFPRYGSAVAAIALGVAISAPQLLPVLNYSQSSHRKSTPTPEGYSAYLGSAIQPFELANLSIPNALGDPREPVKSGDYVISTYWAGFVKRGANFAESAVTIGPLVLALLVLVPWRDKRTWGVSAVGVVAFLLLIGTPLNSVLYFGVPGWSSTGSPGRITALFILCAWVLAGLGWGRDPDRRVVPTLFAMPIIAAGTFFLWHLGSAPAESAEIVQSLQSNPFTNALIAAILAIPVVGLMISEKYRKFSGLAVALAMVVWFTSSANLVTTGIRPAWPEDVAKPADSERVAFMNSGWDLTVRANAVMPPNLATGYRIHDIGGYDSLIDKDVVAKLAEVNGGDAAPPANGNMMFIKPSANPEKQKDLGVSSLYASQAGIVSPVDVGGQRLENTGGPAEIVSEDTQGITIKATGPGTLTLRDRAPLGWWRTVDGKVSEANGDWLTAELPAGEQTVQFWYQPKMWMMGVQIGIVALITAFAVAFRLRKHA